MKSFARLLQLSFVLLFTGSSMILAQAQTSATLKQQTVEVQIPLKGNRSLTATLMTREPVKNSPAVVMIPGYIPGYHNQEEEAWRAPGPGGEDTGTLMARYLVEHGYVVLQIPIAGGANGNEPSLSAGDLAGRAIDCIEYLKHRPEIDPKRVGIIGQSIGGFVAIMAAAQSSDLAFLVTLATPVESIDSMFFDALERVLLSGGAPDDQRAAIRQMMARVFAEAVNGDSAEKIRPNLEAFLRAEYEWLPKQQRAMADRDADEFVKRLIDDHLRDTTSPMFRSLIGYDVTTTMTRIHCPMLILFAENDFKVEPGRSSTIARTALGKAKNTDWDIKIIPNADHFFRGTSPATAPVRNRGEALAPGFLEAVTTWLAKHTAASRL